MAGPDTTNPTLTSVNLPSVDVTSGGETVIFSAGAFDTGSGVDRVYLYFDHGWEGQSGLQSVVALTDSADSFSDGVSSVSVYFDPSSAAGAYDLTSVMVYDKAGNWTQYSASDVAALGLPISFNVVSNAPADTTPPTLTSVTLPSVDVTSGGETAIFSAGAFDTGAGVDRVALYFAHDWESPSGFQNVVTLSDATDSFSDGSSATSIYFDPGTPAGTYEITSAIVYDKAGNFAQYSSAQLAALNLSTSFTVVSNTPADTTAPTLISASLPNVHIASGGETVTFSVDAFDTGTGVDRVYFDFDHGWQGQSGPESVVEFPDSSESFANGVSTTSVYFDRTTEAGTYRVTSAIVYDKAGNFTQYSPTQLGDLGIPISFTVHKQDAHNDFSGDGFSDVLWQADDGTVRDWLGDTNRSGGFSGNTANLNVAVPAGWHIAGTGDFNGDGRVDVLWRADDGTVHDWLGQANGGFAGNTANLNITVPTSWHIVGTGDFNGDGITDILWRADDGTVHDWLGQSNGGFAGNTANLNITVPTSWHVVGTGDFNGDGYTDILWRADDGTIRDWLGQSNGGFAGNTANVNITVPTNWSVVGTGDFNGDGLADILWRNTDGTFHEWLGQSNDTFTGNTAFNSTSFNPGTDWHVAGIGDYNGDTIDDLLLQNSSGTVTDWLGQGNGSFASNTANADIAVPTNWHIQDPFLHDPLSF